MCFFHCSDPDIEAKKQEGRSNGGRVRSLARMDPSVLKSIITPPRTPAEVSELLSRVTACIAGNGTLNARSATSLAYVADKLLRAMEVTSMERRLGQLERQLGLNEKTIDVVDE